MKLGTCIISDKRPGAWNQATVTRVASKSVRGKSPWSLDAARKHFRGSTYTIFEITETAAETPDIIGFVAIRDTAIAAEGEPSVITIT